MSISMYCDICRQPAEIIVYDTAVASSVPQRVKGVYCCNHSPYKMKIVWCGAEKSYAESEKVVTNGN